MPDRDHGINDRGMRMIFPIIVLFIITGCAEVCLRPNFPAFGDQPLSNAETAWLRGGGQTRITPGIRQITSRINGVNRRELFYKAVNYVQFHFRYDDRYLDKAFSLTSEDIFDSGIIGSCSDFAVAEVALLRALGIPARLVLTVNTDWISEYKANDLSIPRGHVFLELYLEEAWLLFDPVYRTLYPEYDPTLKSFPIKQYVVMRSGDFFDDGITKLSDVIDKLEQFALTFDPELYHPPHYSKIYVKVPFAWN